MYTHETLRHSTFQQPRNKSMYYFVYYWVLLTYSAVYANVISCQCLVHNTPTDEERAGRRWPLSTSEPLQICNSNNCQSAGLYLSFFWEIIFSSFHYLILLGQWQKLPGLTVGQGSLTLQAVVLSYVAHLNTVVFCQWMKVDPQTEQNPGSRGKEESG